MHDSGQMNLNKCRCEKRVPGGFPNAIGRQYELSLENNEKLSKYQVIGTLGSSTYRQCTIEQIYVGVQMQSHEFRSM